MASSSSHDRNSASVDTVSCTGDVTTTSGVTAAPSSVSLGDGRSLPPNIGRPVGAGDSERRRCFRLWRRRCDADRLLVSCVDSGDAVPTVDRLSPDPQADSGFVLSADGGLTLALRSRSQRCAARALRAWAEAAAERLYASRGTALRGSSTTIVEASNSRPMWLWLAWEVGVSFDDAQPIVCVCVFSIA